MRNKLVKILYVTCCQNGLFGLEKLFQNGFSYEFSVLTISKAVADEANVSGYVNVLPVCKENNVDVRVMTSYKLDCADIAWIKKLDPDLILVNGWNRLLPDEVLEIPKLGTFGVHAGHPPRGRGRAPIAWSLILGLKDLQVYLFRMTAGADDGDVVAIRRIEITVWDDARTLYDKVMLAISRIYVETIPLILDEKIFETPQPVGWESFHKSRRPDDGLIVWEQSAESLYDFVRGQSTPYPGAFTYFAGERIVVQSGHPFDRILDLGIMHRPGTILEALPSGIVVATGTTPYLIRAANYRGTQLKEEDLLNEFKFKLGSAFETR